MHIGIGPFVKQGDLIISCRPNISSVLLAVAPGISACVSKLTAKSTAMIVNALKHFRGLGFGY